jgi:hypothetical protein
MEMNGSKLSALLRSWLLIGWLGGCLIGFVSVVPARGDIAAPQLKWQKAGCYSSWCETGWYSSPAVADLDSNGRAEVIFTSWTKKDSNHTGKIHILDYRGNPVHEVILPAPVGHSWNGGLPAPTLANIDQDADLELYIFAITSKNSRRFFFPIKISLGDTPMLTDRRKYFRITHTTICSLCRQIRNTAALCQ